MIKEVNIEKESYSTKEAAVFLGIAKSELDKSRVFGHLSGIDAPIFIKIGRRIRYRRKDLVKWLYDQPAHTNIAA